MKPSTAVRRLATLKRRRNYLNRIIDRGDANDFDRREFAALCWAVRALEETWDVAQHVSGRWREKTTTDRSKNNHEELS